MATLYRANGEIEEIDGEGANRTVTLGQCQALVGGIIATVPVGTWRELVVHDEGLLIGLPPNPNATKLAGGTIVGDALLVRFDRAGNWY